MRRSRPVFSRSSAERQLPSGNLLAYLDARSYDNVSYVNGFSGVSSMWCASDNDDMNACIADLSLSCVSTKYDRLIDIMHFPQHPSCVHTQRPVELHPYLLHQPSVVCQVDCGSFGYAALHSSGQLIFYNNASGRSSVLNDHTNNEFIRSIEYFEDSQTQVALKVASSEGRCHTKLYHIDSLVSGVCFSDQQLTSEIYTRYAELFKASNCISWVHDSQTASSYFSQQKAITSDSPLMLPSRKRFKISSSQNMTDLLAICPHTGSSKKQCTRCIASVIMQLSLDVDWIEEPDDSFFTVLQGERPGSVDWMHIPVLSGGMKYLDYLCRVRAICDGIVVSVEDVLLFMVYCSRINQIDDVMQIELINQFSLEHTNLPYQPVISSILWCNARQEVAVANVSLSNTEYFEGLQIQAIPQLPHKCCAFHTQNNSSSSLCAQSSPQIDFFVQYITNTSIHMNPNRIFMEQQLKFLVLPDATSPVHVSIIRRIAMLWLDMEFLISCTGLPSLYLLPVDYLSAFCAFYLYFYPHTLSARGFRVNCLCLQGASCGEDVELPSKWLLSEQYVWGTHESSVVTVTDFYTRVIPSLLWRQLSLSNNDSQGQDGNNNAYVRKEMLKVIPVVPPNNHLKEKLDMVIRDVKDGNASLEWNDLTLADLQSIGSGSNMNDKEDGQMFVAYLMLAKKQHRRIFIEEKTAVPTHIRKTKLEASYLQRRILLQVQSKQCARLSRAKSAENTLLGSPQALGSNTCTPIVSTPSRSSTSRKRKVTSKGSCGLRGKRNRTFSRVSGRVSSRKTLFENENLGENIIESSLLIPEFEPSDVAVLSTVVGANAVHKVRQKMRLFLVDACMAYLASHTVSGNGQSPSPHSRHTIHLASLDVSRTWETSVQPSLLQLPAKLVELAVSKSTILLLQESGPYAYGHNRPVTPRQFHPYFHHDRTLDILMYHGYIPQLQLNMLNYRIEHDGFVSLSSIRAEIALDQVLAPGSPEVPNIPAGFPLEHSLLLLSGAKLLELDFVLTDAKLLQQQLADRITCVLPVLRSVGMLYSDEEQGLLQYYTFHQPNNGSHHELETVFSTSPRMLCLLGNVPYNSSSNEQKSNSYSNIVQLSNGFLVQFTDLPCLFVPYLRNEMVHCGSLADGSLLPVGENALVYWHTLQQVDRTSMTSHLHLKMVHLEGSHEASTTRPQIKSAQHRTPHFAQNDKKLLATPHTVRIRPQLQPRLTLPVTPFARFAPQVQSPTRMQPRQPQPLTPTLSNSIVHNDTAGGGISTYLNRRLSALSTGSSTTNVPTMFNAPLLSPHTSSTNYSTTALPEAVFEHTDFVTLPVPPQPPSASPVVWNFDSANIQLSPLLASPVAATTQIATTRVITSSTPLLPTPSQHCLNIVPSSPPPVSRYSSSQHYLQHPSDDSAALAAQVSFCHLASYNQYLLVAVRADHEHSYQYTPLYDAVTPSKHHAILTNTFHMTSTKHPFSILPLLFCFDACLPVALPIFLRQAYVRQFLKIATLIDTKQLNKLIYSLEQICIRTSSTAQLDEGIGSYRELISNTNNTHGFIVKLHNLARNETVVVVLPESLNQGVSASFVNEITPEYAYGAYSSKLFSSLPHLRSYTENAFLNPSVLNNKTYHTASCGSSESVTLDYAPMYSTMTPSHLQPQAIEKELLQMSHGLLNRAMFLLCDWIKAMSLSVPSPFTAAYRAEPQVAVVPKGIHEVTALLYQSDTQQIIIGSKATVVTVQ